jgi:hypothetical protein
MKYLYHGSTTQNLKTLKPRKRYTPQGRIDYAAIYATPLPGFAATHSFPWSSDEGVGLDVGDKKIFFSIPEKLRERLQVPISIYKISDENFQHTKEELTGYTWHTTQTIQVLDEKQYESVEAALRELGVDFKYV